jgi:hypothetical protein
MFHTNIYGIYIDVCNHHGTLSIKLKLLSRLINLTNSLIRPFLCIISAPSQASIVSYGISDFKNPIGAVYQEPFHTRVRCVARKRHPLAADLAQLFVKTKKRNFMSKATVSGTYVL